MWLTPPSAVACMLANKLVILSSVTNENLSLQVEHYCIYCVMQILYFMKPEDSLPCSQEPAIGPCPEPDISSPNLTNKLHTAESFLRR
jgi:hypothetical protein